jgi:cobalamin biosynthetic protein CobC
VLANAIRAAAAIVEDIALTGTGRARFKTAMGRREHGGDLAAAMARFGGGRADWLDLSTGINPNPWPMPEIPQRFLTALPERADVETLVAAARTAYGVHSGNRIVPAGGAQALIQIMPALAEGRDARVLAPTYNEHAGRFADSGRAPRDVADVADLEGADAAVLVNPNNPDGRRTKPARLLDLAGQVGFLVVDESFCDVTPALSLCPEKLPENVIVLRSFGKFFGLAGLRLGFAVAAEDAAERLARTLGPWAVSGPALFAGAAALADTAWIEATRRDLAAAMARFRNLLEDAGFEIVGGTDLFVTARSGDTGGWLTRFAAHHVHVRPFGYAPDWLRFGLPPDEAGWRQIETALTS